MGKFGTNHLIYSPVSITIQFMPLYIDGLVQDCSNSSANALELPQFAPSHRYNGVIQKLSP